MYQVTENLKLILLAPLNIKANYYVFYSIQDTYGRTNIEQSGFLFSFSNTTQDYSNTIITVDFNIIPLLDDTYFQN